MTFTIRTHLLLLILAPSALMLAAVGYDIYGDLQQSAASAKTSLRVPAHVIATNTGARIADARQILALLAEHPLVKRVDATLCNDVLKELRTLSPDYTNIIYTDLNGRTICSLQPPADGMQADVGKAPWFEQSLKEKRFTVGQPHYLPSSGKWVLTLSAPIWNEQREMAGAILLSLDLPADSRQIQGLDLPAEGHYGFFDRSGSMIWSNRPAESEGETRADTAIARQLVDMRSGEFEGTGGDGVTRHFSAMPIPETEWIAFVSAPTAILFANTKRNALIHASFALLLIGALIRLAMILARRIARPIAELEKTARAVHNGESGVRATVAGPREVAAVAEAFNSMIDAQLHSREHFSALLEQSPDAIAITTCELDNTIVNVNPAYCLLSGYTREELLDHRAANLDLWENSAQGLAAKALLIRGTPVNDLLSMFRRRDGNLIPTSLSGRRITINGAPHLQVVRRDISERMLNELRLKESEERWRFAVEGHGDALWDWNVATRTAYRSVRFLVLLGIPDAPSLCTIDELTKSIHPADIPLIEEQNKKLLRGITSDETGECRLRGRDGEVIWVSYRCCVMRRDAEGRAERVIGTIRDISRRKRRQQEMDVQMGKLSHQARLLALGEMASATAHEINQPLTAIATYASACARQLDDRPKSQDIVRRIEAQALRAGQIVWRMRDFAKRRRTRCQAVKVEALVADVFEWLSWDRRANEITFESTISADLPAVPVDRIQIEQVLLNLIWNGIQAMTEMPFKKVIEVGAALNTAGNGIIVTVADRGCGLPSHVALDLFTPFVTSKPDGLGLGLSISRTIISQHDGMLWSAPREGGGSVFSFSLPLSDVYAQAETDQPRATE